jgi:hypothetical protein
MQPGIQLILSYILLLSGIMYVCMYVCVCVYVCVPLIIYVFKYASVVSFQVFVIS